MISSTEKKSLIVTVFLLLLIIASCGSMMAFVLSDPAIKYSQILTNAALTVRSAYPDRLDWDSILVSARKAMTDELDPFSGYVDRENLNQFMEDLSGGYYGIGISVVPVDSGLLVFDVREGSPAATSGILPGDMILAADSINFLGRKPAEALKAIRGEEGTILSAKVYRPAISDTLFFEVIRKRIGFLHIPFAGLTKDSAVYIRLLDFNAGAADIFRESLDTLIGDSGRKASAVIIDLRGNPGGLFSEARDIAQLFLKKGEFIVGTTSRSKWNEESHVAKSDGDYSWLPLAILIDNGSASAAEILAGTLKYSGHAVLVGDTTFGKGLVQGYVRLPEGDGLRLTISRYFFQGNRYINSLDSAAKVQGVGIAPDIFYKTFEDEPFYLELEWKLILLRFAHLHQEEIIAASTNPEEQIIWLKRLREYALENKFSYKSETAKSAEKLLEEVESSALKKQANKALNIAEHLDTQLFEKFGDYLWLRLRQIAYERKFSTYRAYKEIIVPNSEIVKVAQAAIHKKVAQ